MNHRISPRAATCSGLAEQRAEVAYLDDVARIPQQRKAEILLDGLQQGIVPGERGVDTMTDAPGYHDHRDVAAAIDGAAGQVTAAAGGGVGGRRGQDGRVRPG